MTKYYSKFYDEVAEKHNFVEGDIPEKNTEFVAYASVQDVRENNILAKSKNRYELQRKHSKSIIEEIGDNTEYDNYWKKRATIESEAFAQWFNYLRSEYNHVNEETFDICYSMAYDRGHSFGYNEVQNHLHDYIDFAEKIIHANKI